MRRRLPLLSATLMLVACGERGSLPAQAFGNPDDELTRVAPLVQRADSLERAAVAAAGTAVGAAAGAARWDAVAAAWHAAASESAELSPWFTLKAAAANPRAPQRAEWLADLRLPATGDSVAWARRKAGAHLRAMLRYGDTTGAVALYLSLGNVRDSVVGLSFRLRSGDTLTDAEHLALARGARRIGDSPLARREYRTLIRGANRALTSRDVYDYGMLLFSAGVYAEALEVFSTVRGPSAGLAAYQRARTQLRMGRAAAAITALQAVSRRYAADTNAAGYALYLLGDLAADAGRDAQAADTWRSLGQRYPSHALAASATFRAAMVHVAAGRWSQAESLLLTLSERRNAEQVAARYWLARAQAARGRTGEATRQWRAIVRDVPDSYYALLAAQRLDTVPWRADPEKGNAGRVPPPRDEADALTGTIAQALIRSAWLDSLALHDEASDERADLQRWASADTLRARATAHAFVEQGFASPAITLALRVPAIARSTAADDQRLRYPLPFRDALAASAREHALDLPFVAALIRQESRFTPTARSGAGARGLMQVMPSVGRSLGGRFGIRPWHDSLLYVPAVNLRIGSAHLAAALQREGAVHPAYALAAYNAGRSRMLRWRAKPGAARDWELFVERIPYVETRDYVRIVLRNAEWYRVLHDGDTAASRGDRRRSQDE